jgi:hypothetical protein
MMANQFSIRPNAEPDQSNWGFVLVVCCLALGVTIAWGTYERRARLSSQEQSRRDRHQVDLLSASLNADLGPLLADPRTQLSTLSETAGDASTGLTTPIRRARVAWNDQRQSGALLCDPLPATPAGQRYQLWLVPSAGSRDQAIKLTTIAPEAGATVYSFQADHRAAGATTVVLTIGPDAATIGAGGVAVLSGELH